MKIILATGIYPPEPGGPAIHVARFAAYLRTLSHEVHVITYSRYLLAGVTVVGRYTPPGIRHAVYTQKLYRLSKNADAIFAFDAWSAGAPAAFVAELRAIPLVLRVGGDFLWEQAVNRRHIDVPLNAYYEKSLFTATERLKRAVISWTMHKAEVLVTPTTELCALYRTYYHLNEESCRVIQNPMHVASSDVLHTETPSGSLLARLEVQPARLEVERPMPRIFLFAGRLVYLKNLHRLIGAAAALRTKGNTNFRIRLVGSGPEEASLRRAVARADMVDYITFVGEKSPIDVAEEIQRAHVSILLSLSEVSPNFILQSLAAGLPCIVTKYNGIYERIAPFVTHVDPFSMPEIVAAMEELIRIDGYEKRCRAFIALSQGVDTADTDEEFLNAIRHAVSATRSE